MVSFSPSACAKASFTKKKELSQRFSFVRVAARCSPEHCSSAVINPVMILQILNSLHYIPHEEDLDWPSPKCPFHSRSTSRAFYSDSEQ